MLGDWNIVTTKRNWGLLMFHPVSMDLTVTELSRPLAEDSIAHYEGWQRFPVTLRVSGKSCKAMQCTQKQRF
jgi:hypothetical protein